MAAPKIAPPLSNAVTHILLALARRDLHGYGIMQEIAAISGGEYKLGPGTLYDNLKTLLASGVVTEFTEKNVPGEARRLYHLTDSGAVVLDAELKRLRNVVQAGRKRLPRIGEAQ
ncbi:MAG TPA: PadR family transcriptional regulator [Acidobacteriaceae bacterium]